MRIFAEGGGMGRQSETEDRPLGPRFDDALAFASRLHRGQVRKGSGTPYIAHLMSVSALVLEHGGSEDQAIAGLLHDAAEDQGGAETLEAIRARFGEAVARIVADCTDAWESPKPPWRARKRAYIAALPDKDPASLLVSLADKTHNARAILGDYRELGDALWDRFAGKKDGTLWYYHSLAAAFRQLHPGPLADELARTVAGFAGEDQACPR
jgi:(p)ppGpp synthase/HD superfamily hydrolase